MTRKRVTVVLGLWLAILVVACSEDLFTPARSSSVVPKYTVIHPTRPRLRVENAYACGTVEYVGAEVNAKHGYRRAWLWLMGENRPAVIQPQPGAEAKTTLGRFHYISWDKKTRRMLFEADCIIPLSKEATRFAVAQIEMQLKGRTLASGPNAGVVLAANSATALASGFEGTITCWYDPSDGSFECPEGVMCYR
jgi:hypothetical protein